MHPLSVQERLVALDVGEPQGVSRLRVKLAVHQILVGGDVHEIAPTLLQAGQTRDRQVAHDLGDQFRVHDETVLDREGRSDPTLAVSGARARMEFADRIGQQEAANVAISGSMVLVVIEGRPVEIGDPTGGALGVTQVD